jgi:processive 1,2-diacylglycerol beta-glucosyltransferase
VLAAAGLSRRAPLEPPTGALSPATWPEGGQKPIRALIVSATVGAGDAGNARELARRLTESGHTAAVRDFLEAAPFGIGKALSKGYEAELRHAPWAYGLAFGMWYWCPLLLGPLARALSLFTRRAILRWVAQTRADVVVSTYPVATQVLGDMRRRSQRRWRWRRRGALLVPAVNVVTDFGYHPFWAHPGIDLNLAVNPATAASLARRTGRPSLACAPLVAPQFGCARPRRRAVRAALGLPPGAIAALISSGSLGIGAVREALGLLSEEGAGEGKVIPVVACGRNASLRRELEALVQERGYSSVVLGWTDDMAGLMAACDVLVENAGGLTSLEALAAGLPIVNFRPIPGHGKKSAAAMAAAGVSRRARSGRELVEGVRELGRPSFARRAQLAAAATLFSLRTSADPALAVAQAAASGTLPPLSMRPLVRVARAGSAAVLAGAVAWAGLTTGVGVAAAAGMGVAHSPVGTNAVYIGVRLDAPELASGPCRRAVAQLGASAVVDLATAEADPRALWALVATGADLESGGGGQGGGPGAPWSQAQSDTTSVQVLSALAARPVGDLVLDRALSAFDLVDAVSAHLRMVVPGTTLPLRPSGPYPQQLLALPVLQQGQIYLVQGAQLSPPQLVVLLNELRSQARGEKVAIAPLSALR